jgi:hypothetical protein
MAFQTLSVLKPVTVSDIMTDGPSAWGLSAMEPHALWGVERRGCLVSWGNRVLCSVRPREE